MIQWPPVVNAATASARPMMPSSPTHGVGDDLLTATFPTVTPWSSYYPAPVPEESPSVLMLLGLDAATVTQRCRRHHENHIAHASSASDRAALAVHVWGGQRDVGPESLVDLAPFVTTVTCVGGDGPSAAAAPSACELPVCFPQLTSLTTSWCLPAGWDSVDDRRSSDIIDAAFLADAFASFDANDPLGHWRPALCTLSVLQRLTVVLVVPAAHVDHPAVPRAVARHWTSLTLPRFLVHRFPTLTDLTLATTTGLPELDPTAALTPMLHLTRAEVLQEEDDEEELLPPQLENGEAEEFAALTAADRVDDKGSKKKCLIS
jgi:hypothetical protein